MVKKQAHLSCWRVPSLRRGHWAASIPVLLPAWKCQDFQKNPKSATLAALLVSYAFIKSDIKHVACIRNALLSSRLFLRSHFFPMAQKEKKLLTWRFIRLESAFRDERAWSRSDFSSPIAPDRNTQVVLHFGSMQPVGVFPKLIISLLWEVFAFFFLEKAVIITSMNEHDHHHWFPVFKAAPIPLHNHYLVYEFCQWQ